MRSFGEIERSIHQAKARGNEGDSPIDTRGSGALWAIA